MISQLSTQGFAALSLLLTLWHVAHGMLDLQHRLWQQHVLQKSFTWVVKADAALSIAQSRFMVHHATGCHQEPNMATCATQWQGITVHCKGHPIQGPLWLITWHAQGPGVLRQKTRVWHSSCLSSKIHDTISEVLA